MSLQGLNKFMTPKNHEMICPVCGHSLDKNNDQRIYSCQWDCGFKVSYELVHEVGWNKLKLIGETGHRIDSNYSAVVIGIDQSGRLMLLEVWAGKRDDKWFAVPLALKVGQVDFTTELTGDDWHFGYVTCTRLSFVSNEEKLDVKSLEGMALRVSDKSLRDWLIKEGQKQKIEHSSLKNDDETIEILKMLKYDEIDSTKKRVFVNGTTSPGKEIGVFKEGIKEWKAFVKGTYSFNGAAYVPATNPKSQKMEMLEKSREMWADEFVKKTGHHPTIEDWKKFEEQANKGLSEIKTKKPPLAMNVYNRELSPLEVMKFYVSVCKCGMPPEITKQSGGGWDIRCRACERRIVHNDSDLSLLVKEWNKFSKEGVTAKEFMKAYKEVIGEYKTIANDISPPEIENTAGKNNTFTITGVKGQGIAVSTSAGLHWSNFFEDVNKNDFDGKCWCCRASMGEDHHPTCISEKAVSIRTIRELVNDPKIEVRKKKRAFIEDLSKSTRVNAKPFGPKDCKTNEAMNSNED